MLRFVLPGFRVTIKEKKKKRENWKSGKGVSRV